MPEDFGAPKGHRTFQPLLVADRVRHVGDRVAFVVAETLAQARDAAELVEVDYEPLPAVVDIEDAAKPDAPKVWDDNPHGNNAFRLMFGNKEATDAAFAERQARRQAARREQPPVAGLDGAARRHRRLQRAPTITTRSTAPSQNPHGARMELSHIFHMPENQIRVVSPDVGGGFGLKGGAFPDDVLVMWASQQAAPSGEVGRDPQRKHDDRPPRPRDGLLRRAGARRARQDSRAALASRCSRSARISSARRWPPAPSRSASCRRPTTSRPCTSMSQGVFTNTSQSGPYRGAGRPEAAYFIERLIEHAAQRDRHGPRRNPPRAI